jgi:hypothetical protein
MLDALIVIAAFAASLGAAMLLLRASLEAWFWMLERGRRRLLSGAALRVL